MPAQIVYEVWRRTSNGPVHVALFTDGFLAKQAIDALYERLRQSVLKADGIETLFAAGFEPAVLASALDWSTWSVNDMNSPTPVFWTSKKKLWNSVPTVDWHTAVEADIVSPMIDMEQL